MSFGNRQWFSGSRHRLDISAPCSCLVSELLLKPLAGIGCFEKGLVERLATFSLGVQSLRM